MKAATVSELAVEELTPSYVSLKNPCLALDQLLEAGFLVAY